MYEILHNAIRDFPKLEKYSLGVRIEKIVLDCLNACFLATALPPSLRKFEAVATASACFDTLKIFTRLAVKTKCLEEKIYLKLIPRFGTIGNMLGGWLKEAKKFSQVAEPNPKPKPNLTEPSQPQS